MFKITNIVSLNNLGISTIYRGCSAIF